VKTRLVLEAAIVMMQGLGKQSLNDVMAALHTLRYRHWSIK
jgi:hypothetical protein